MIFEFYIENKKVTEFVEWSDSILQAISKESEIFRDVDADIVIDDVTIVKDALQQVKDVYNDSAKGQFYKPSVKIVLEDNGTYEFNGYITDITYQGDTDKAVISIVKQDGIFTLEDDLSGLTVRYLNDESPYKQQDFKYVAVPLDRKVTLLMLTLSQFTYGYILGLQIKDNADQVANLAEATTPVIVPPNAPAVDLGAVLSASLKAAGSLAFTTVTVIQMVKTAKQIKELAYPTIQKTKVTSLYELLDNPLRFLGYELVTDIEELKNVHVWSSFASDENWTLPNESDNGYNVIDTFAFVQKKVNGKFKIEGKKVYFYWENSDIWEKGVNYELREDVITSNFKYNTDEHVASYLVNYQEDYNDEYTLENYKGTSYLVTSDNKDSLSDKRRSNVKGYFRTDYPYALANRKDSLDAVEKAVNTFIKIANSAIKIFGGKTINLLSNTRIGIGLVSNIQFSIPKLVYLEGGKIPPNHRSKLSAKADYDNWHHSKSFVTNKSKTLRKNIEDVRITYKGSDFFKNITNPFFKTRQGEVGKFTNVDWKFDRDYADVQFWIRSEYITNLRERFYESSK